MLANKTYSSDDNFEYSDALADKILQNCADVRIHPIFPECRRWEHGMVLHHASLLNSSEKVLDAGCGTSIFPLILSELGHNVTTVDFNFADRLDMWWGATLGYPDIQNIDGDITDGNFMNRFYSDFDVVTCISVLEHVTDNILINLGKCLNSSGVLALTCDFSTDEVITTTDDPLYQRQTQKYSKYDTIVTEKRLLRLIQEAELSLIGDYDYTIREIVSDAPYTLASVLCQ